MSLAYWFSTSTVGQSGTSSVLGDWPRFMIENENSQESEPLAKPPPPDNIKSWDKWDLSSPFLENIKNLAPYLGKRMDSFETLFKCMVELYQSNKGLHIVETGCARIAGNWEGDGMSTVLFDAFIAQHPGCTLDSYDISIESCTCARQLIRDCNDSIQIHCMDAVHGLWEYKGVIDILYLDSFDVDFDAPEPSARHHLKELCVAMNKLAPEALIMIDDNAHGRGKGEFVREVMDAIGATCLYDGYQLLFRMPKTSNRAISLASLRNKGEGPISLGDIKLSIYS